MDSLCSVIDFFSFKYMVSYALICFRDDCFIVIVCNVSGSVIKHQLVTHLTLGIALRGVLDALRKPADSKVRNISH